MNEREVFAILSENGIAKDSYDWWQYEMAIAVLQGAYPNLKRGSPGEQKLFELAKKYIGILDDVV